MEARRFGSLVTGMAVLEKLAAAPKGASVTALARLLELDKGYLHRLLRTLERLGYVEQSPTTKLFHTTVKFVTLASVILQNLDVLEAAPPVMRRLLGASGESVHLARRIKTGGVYIAQELPSAGERVEIEIGSQPELHCAASGKALLAFLDEAEIRALVSEPFPRHTHRTISSLDDLVGDLKAARARGYALDDEECEADIRCLAAPIFDAIGRAVASIGVSGPTSRLTLRRVPTLGSLVAGAAEEISLKIGGEFPLVLSAAGVTTTARFSQASP